MIIDAHYHLDPRLETVDRLLDQMRKHAIDRVALVPTLVEPFHLGRLAEAASRGMRGALLGKMRSLGFFMYRTTVTKAGKFSILGSTYSIYDTVDNAATALVLAAHPEKFWGWILVNPAVGVSVAEVERWAGTPGWVGVKAHPFWHRYPVALLDDVAALCAGRGMPLLIHLGGNAERGDFRRLPDRHPGLPVIYAHAGIPYYRELWEYAKGRKNVYVDLSSPYLDEPLRREALAALGPGKCLYGSDGPYGYPDPADGGYDHGAIIEEVRRAPLNNAERELVFSGNFRAITGVRV